MKTNGCIPTAAQAVLFLSFAAALSAPPARANVVGGDAQNFNSVTNGLDFVTVHSSETLKPGIFNFGLFLNYAVNTLPYQEANAGQSRADFNDSLLGADFNFGVGILENWDAGVSFPQILSQSVDSNTGARGQFAENGLTEVRVNTKYRVWGDDSGGIALVASANFNQTTDNPFTGQNAGPTLNLEAAADQTLGKFTVGGNIGYRIRDPGSPLPGIGIQPFSDQIIASVAANYLIEGWDTKVIGEVFGAVPAETTDYNTDRKQSSLELLAGLKHDVNPNLAAHAGFGTELIHGNASPDWRVYVGLNYTFGPVFSKAPDVRRSEPAAGADEDPFSRTPQEPIETFVVRDVLFKFDSDELEDSSRETLDKLAVYLMKPPAFKRMDISGHTDSIGRAVYNLDLSQRRAQRVKRYLVERHNLPADRIGAHGYGEGVPIADNGNYQGRALNRRVEFKITREFNTEASHSPPVSNATVDDGQDRRRGSTRKEAPAKRPMKPKASPKPKPR